MVLSEKKRCICIKEYDLIFAHFYVGVEYNYWDYYNEHRPEIKHNVEHERGITGVVNFSQHFVDIELRDEKIDIIMGT